MRLPDRLDLGQQSQTPLYTLFVQFENQGRDNSYGQICDVGPRVLGFVLPSFQRPVVWTEEQMVRFVENLHRGVHPGTYTYNSTYGFKENEFTDENGNKRFRGGNWLLDGQQRLTSIERYWTNQFPVFDLYWRDLDRSEKMNFLMNTQFPSYECKLKDEESCRKIYDIMAFGGVPHQEHERAMPYDVKGF